jgi:lipopolysaccharide/colanic/teichoic acid biosynthesis glycosyltransferase
VSTFAPTDTEHTVAVPVKYTPASTHDVLDEKSFKCAIVQERKRAERTSEAFLLLLLSTGEQPDIEKGHKLLRTVIPKLMLSIRETDVVGWHRNKATVGILFTSIDATSPKAVLGAVLERVSAALRTIDKSESLGTFTISSHFFPDQWDHTDADFPHDPTLYPDLPAFHERRRSFGAIKRVMDVIGSALALLLSAPLFIAIAMVVKATSTGPVFFKQQRVGQYGKLFTMLKFRSMTNNTDPTDHKDFVTGFIKGSSLAHVHHSGQKIYKLTKDTRVTAVGRFLRKSSLDELPQFINVLKGEMSLVGPRPAISYEVSAYRPWHRRRLLEAKPGITGPWQVGSRCRSTFDEMVRLDLRYAASWTPWMDLQILLRTPRAVLKGSGAC